MRDLRLERGETAEDPSWKKAGWTRAPRNGYEWRRVKDGKPQPVERDKRWKKNYKCRACGGSAHKVHAGGDGKGVRRCIPCRAKYAKGYYENNREKYKSYSYKHKADVQGLVVAMEDGWFTIPFSFILRKGAVIPEMARDGRIVVEYMGEPAFAIVSIEDARRL